MKDLFQSANGKMLDKQTLTENSKHELGPFAQSEQCECAEA